jgi:hypothetical protein
MITQFTYEIVSVNQETKTMEISFSANNAETFLVGAKIPLVTEDLDTVIRSYAPLHHWSGVDQAETATIQIGHTGVVPVNVPQTEEERQQELSNANMWTNIEFDRQIAASLVRLNVLETNPTAVQVTTV